MRRNRAGVEMNDPMSVDLLAREYDQLKQEQQARISHRDNLLYATLAVYGAAGLTALSGRPLAWLAAPLAAVVLGWTYVANDAKVSAIGAYIRTELGPHLTDLSGSAQPVFGWETWHRAADPHRRVRKVMWFGVDLTTYAAVPLGALTAYWSTGPYAAPLVAVSIAEAAAVLVLAGQINANADLIPPAAWRRRHQL